MKKTLKFLLAITLFVAILAIATGVNAASLKDLKDAGTLTESATAGTTTKTYSNAAELTDDVEIDESIIFSAGAAVSGTMTVNKGTTTLTGASAASTLTKVVVKKGATLIINDAKITATLIVNEGGTIKVKDAANVTEIKQNSTGMTYSMDGKVTAVNPTAADSTKTYAAYTLKEKTTDGYTDVYLSAEDIKVEVNFKNGELEVVNTLVKDEKYTYEAKAFWGNKELVADVELSNTTETAKDNAEFDGDVVVFSDDSEILATVDGEAVIAIAVKLGEVKPTETPTVTPTEAPATEAPATTAPATNDGDKDETPKTGDQIIPATALLAVVVVANVVYFAKSKRS